MAKINEQLVRDTLNKVFPEGDAVIPRGGLTVAVSIPIDTAYGYDFPDGHTPDPDMIDEAADELSEVYDDLLDELEKQGVRDVDYLSASVEDLSRHGVNRVELVVYLYA